MENVLPVVCGFVVGFASGVAIMYYCKACTKKPTPPKLQLNMKDVYENL